MEKDERKRAREGDNRKDSKPLTKKKIDLSHSSNFHMKNYENEIENTNNNNVDKNYYTSSSSCNNKDVFDFPWLHEGDMISKSEEWGNFEDVFTFCSSLEDESCTTGGGGGFEFCGESATCSLIDFPEERFDDNIKFNLDDDGVDCIWSSLIDQPIQQKEEQL
ncbi:hypothetical protein ACFE04_030632 [Oxalis oulophora]